LAMFNMIPLIIDYTKKTEKLYENIK